MWKMKMQSLETVCLGKLWLKGVEQNTMFFSLSFFVLYLSCRGKSGMWDMV